MMPRAFAFFANTYVFLVALSAVVSIVAVVCVVWMATTNSVSPELVYQVGAVSRSGQDPAVEAHIPLNTEVHTAFRTVSVPGWEFEFETDHQEQRLLHTLGLLSLHNGGTYQVEPLTAPVEFISALEEASRQGVLGVEQFIATAGDGPSWRDSRYEKYETVMVALVPNATEEYLLKGFWGSGTIAIGLVTGTIVAFIQRSRKSNGKLGDPEAV